MHTHEKCIRCHKLKLSPRAPKFWSTTKFYCFHYTNTTKFTCVRNSWADFMCLYLKCTHRKQLFSRFRLWQILKDSPQSMKWMANGNAPVQLVTHIVNLMRFTFCTHKIALHVPVDWFYYAFTECHSTSDVNLFTHHQPHTHIGKQSSSTTNGMKCTNDFGRFC